MKCVYGLCTNDSRYRYKYEKLKNVRFCRFPQVDKDIEKCKRWIELCGRRDLTLDKIKYWTYVCSDHFVDKFGPTVWHPDPVPFDDAEILRPKQVCNSNTYCCVPTCKSIKRRNPDVSFHKFPAESEKVRVKTKFGGYVSISRLQAWINKVKIVKKVSPFMKICSLHFVEDDYFRAHRRKNLKKNAIPSVNLPPEYTATSNRKKPLKEDMDNYYEVQLMGNSIKKRMKRHVVPHLALGPENKNVEPATSLDSQLDPLGISKPSTSNQENTATISVSSDILIDPLDICQADISDHQDTPLAISVPANIPLDPLDPLEISSPTPSTSNCQENVMKMSVPQTLIPPKTQPVKPSLITSVKNNMTLAQPVSLAPNKKYILVPVQTFNSTEFQKVHFPSPNNTNLRFVLQPQNPANILLNTNSNGTIRAPSVPNIATPCRMIAANISKPEMSDESILPDISYGSKNVDEVQIKEEVPDESQVEQEKNQFEDSGSTSTSDSCNFTVPPSKSRELTEHCYSKSAYKPKGLHMLENDVWKQLREQKEKEKRLKKRILRLVRIVNNLKQSKAKCKCYFASI